MLRHGTSTRLKHQPDFTSPYGYIDCTFLYTAATPMTLIQTKTTPPLPSFTPLQPQPTHLRNPTTTASSTRRPHRPPRLPKQKPSLQLHNTKRRPLPETQTPTATAMIHPLQLQRPQQPALPLLRYRKQPLSRPSATSTSTPTSTNRHTRHADLYSYIQLVLHLNRYPNFFRRRHRNPNIFEYATETLLLPKRQTPQRRQPLLDPTSTQTQTPLYSDQDTHITQTQRSRYSDLTPHSPNSNSQLSTTQHLLSLNDDSNLHTTQTRLTHPPLRYVYSNTTPTLHLRNPYIHQNKHAHTHHDL